MEEIDEKRDEENWFDTSIDGDNTGLKILELLLQLEPLREILGLETKKI